MIEMRREKRWPIELQLEISSLFKQDNVKVENINAPIGLTTYQLKNTLPEEMKAFLLELEEIVKRLQIFEGYENN